MGWTRTEDDRWMNPKILEAGWAAAGLDSLAIGYAHMQSTNGFISKTIVKLMAYGMDPEPVVSKLVQVGRWTVDEKKDGYWIVNYLEFQPSEEEVLEMKEARSEHGRKAANKRWDGSRKAKSDAQMPNGCSSDAQAMLVDATYTLTLTDTLTIKEEGLKEAPQLAIIEVPPISEPTPIRERHVVARKSRGYTEAPDHLEITETMRTWAANNSPLVKIETETEIFLNHHRSKGNIFKDWNSAWWKWMLKEQGYINERAKNQSKPRPLSTSDGISAFRVQIREEQERLQNQAMLASNMKALDVGGDDGAE